MIMEGTALLVKTDKGKQELAQRSGAVSQKQRAVLIMVDDKTRWDDLLARYSGLPEFNEHLLWLVSNGFVAAMGGAGGTVSRTAMEHTAFTPSATGRAGLIELAHHLLGGHGTIVIQRLQDTEDAHDALVQAVERCCKLIKLSIDENKAEQFRMQGLKLLG